MNNDFRDNNLNPDPNRPDLNRNGPYKKSNSGLWLSLGAIAVVALVAWMMASAGTAPDDAQTADQPYASSAATPGMGAAPSDIEPAEGATGTTGSMTGTAGADTTSGAIGSADQTGTASDTSGATAGATPGTTASDTPSATPSVTTSPVEDTASPNTYASEDECKSATNKPCHYVTCDSVPEGRQPDEACGPSFQKGWQPVVPATDTTSVPEQVAPPLTGQQDGAVQSPTMTGQDPSSQTGTGTGSGTTSP